MKKIPYTMVTGELKHNCPYKQIIPFDWYNKYHVIAVVGGYFCTRHCKYFNKEKERQYVICNFDNFKIKLKFVKELIK